jgi:signal transduction histidine kinase
MLHSCFYWKYVVVDKNRITQVISNLLENALKFTSEGAISIRVSRKKKREDHQEEAIVTVENTGSGISPEIFPRLFTSIGDLATIDRAYKSDSTLL